MWMRPGNQRQGGRDSRGDRTVSVRNDHLADVATMRPDEEKEPCAMTEASSSAPSGLPGGAGAGHWVLDPAKSSASFSSKTM